MSKEEINSMIEKNKQSVSNILNEYKIIKNTTESDDDDNSSGNAYLIKQDVDTIEFDDKDDDNSNIKELKPPNEEIDILKKEIMMSIPEDDN